MPYFDFLLFFCCIFVKFALWYLKKSRGIYIIYYKSFTRWNTDNLSSFLKDSEKIGFLGFGRSNRAVLEYLGKFADVQAVIRDEKDVGASHTDAKVLCGRHAFDEPYEDILFLSPSVRRERAEIKKMLRRGVRLSSDAELFFSLCRSPVLAVSGSDGKSTTVKMAEAILRRGGVSALACGNVGIPFVTALCSDVSCAVAEISSFTLEYTAPKTRRAVITNITENHLDWHGSFDGYIKAKENLILGTKEAILSPDTAASLPLIDKHRPWGLFSSRLSYALLSRRYPFAKHYFTAEDGAIRIDGEPVIAIDCLARREEHNIQNALAAMALTHGLFNTDGGIEALSDFKLLPHRMEEVALINGVRFVDSSIDSTPNRTAVTLSAMPSGITVILGGRGKGLSYAPLVDALSEKAKSIVICGENRQEIYAALSVSPTLSQRVVMRDGLREAVRYAMENASYGDTVLLSPASTSFDAFSSFEERGNKFKEFINSEG